LGLLGGAVLTALRTLQNRHSQPEPAAPPAAWEPIPDTTPVTVPDPQPQPQPQPEPEPERPPVAAPAAAPEATPAPLNLLQEAPPAAKKQAKKAPAKKAAKKKAPAPWVDPVDGGCPGSHPVKAKLASKIFHVPGGFNYPRTNPDRCYIDTAAAEADGLRLSKR
jgi:outer membrane biosynthesis protein TonB